MGYILPINHYTRVHTKKDANSKQKIKAYTVAAPKRFEPEGNGEKSENFTRVKRKIRLEKVFSDLTGKGQNFNKTI